MGLGNGKQEVGFKQLIDDALEDERILQGGAPAPAPGAPVAATPQALEEEEPTDLTQRGTGPKKKKLSRRERLTRAGIATSPLGVQTGPSRRATAFGSPRLGV